MFVLVLLLISLVIDETSVHAKYENMGAIMVGESHNFISQAYVCTDKAEYDALHAKGLGYYKKDLSGYKKNVDLFFVNTGLSNEMGSVSWVSGKAISEIKKVQNSHPEITKWAIYVQHGASSATKASEDAGIWKQYPDVFKKYASTFGKVYVMAIPPINEKVWKEVFKDQPAVASHNNEQVQRFNSYLRSVCNGSTIKFINCYPKYVGQPFADKSVGVTGSIKDPNHYAASTYARVIEWVLFNTVGRKVEPTEPESSESEESSEEHESEKQSEEGESDEDDEDDEDESSSSDGYIEESSDEGSSNDDRPPYEDDGIHGFYIEKPVYDRIGIDDIEYILE